MQPLEPPLPSYVFSPSPGPPSSLFCKIQNFFYDFGEPYFVGFTDLAAKRVGSTLQHLLRFGLFHRTKKDCI